MKVIVKRLLGLLLLVIGLYVPASFGARLAQSKLNTYLTFFENKTTDANYLLYIGRDDDSQFLLTPGTAINLDRFKGIKEQLFISSLILIHIKSLNDKYPSLYMQFGGSASGTCPAGYQGPYFISMWRGHADMPYAHRYFVSYCQKGTHGSLGVWIHQEGVPEITTVENTHLVGSGNPVYEKFKRANKLTSPGLVVAAPPTK